MRDPAPGGFSPRELRLPASSSELQRAREYADDAAAAFGFGRSDRFQFVFAVNEAVTNAIRHGAPDAAGTIGLRVTAIGDHLTVTVCDCGQFVTPVNAGLMADHGRGMEMMATLVDDFDVSAAPGGTIVRLGKRRRAPDILAAGDHG